MNHQDIKLLWLDIGCSRVIRSRHRVEVMTDLVVRTKCSSQFIPLFQIHKSSTVVKVADVANQRRLWTEWQEPTLQR